MLRLPSDSRRRWIVVGAGFTGAVLARLIAERRNEKVLVLERRPHPGGNAYDEDHPTGLRIHRYGAHIFHTDSERVFGFLSRFTRWRRYEHRVLARVEGQLVPLPFDLTSIERLFPPKTAARLEKDLLSAYGLGARAPVMRLKQSGQRRLRDLGEFVYRAVFLNYSRKQWGLLPDQLSPDVTARVPVVVDRGGSYFRDRYQGLPADGYTALFLRMLTHRNITALFGADFRDFRPRSGQRLVFTGPIDEYFGGAEGPLPYRSLRFEWKTAPSSRCLPAAVVNYPAARRHTRVIDFGRMSDAPGSRTVQATETPIPHEAGRTEPLYPLPTAEARARYARYARAAQALRGRVLFAGRLADFRYYDMDQAVGRAMTLFEKACAT